MLTVFQFIIFKETKTRPTATRSCKRHGQHAKRDEPCQEVNPIKAGCVLSYSEIISRLHFHIFCEFYLPDKWLETNPHVAQPKYWHGPGPASLVRPEHGIPPAAVIQPHRAREDRQRGMAGNPQIQVCKACSIMPKVLQLGVEQRVWIPNPIFYF